jgi:hypothetical protein
MKRNICSWFVMSNCVIAIIFSIFLMMPAGCGSSNSDGGADAEKLNGSGGKPVAAITNPIENITIFSHGWVDFAGSVTGGDELKSCLWDFGNGISTPNMVDPAAIQYENAGTYTARFSVVDADGDESSAERTITVVDDTAKEIAPADGYISTDGSAEFSWEPMSMAVSYILEIEPRIGGNPEMLEYDLTVTSQKVSSLAAGTYIWCVYGVDKEGNVSRCSVSRTLKVQLP